MKLPDGYEIREMTTAEFDPLWRKHVDGVFEDSQIFRVFQFISDDERRRMNELGKFAEARFDLNLGLFFKGEFVGWSAGHQESAETYYMRNSAVLPEHRRKGLYAALMKRTIEILETKGFQKIYSRHNATNNAVIIPKLKAGFVIASLEVCDKFGVLVHLVYHPNALRRKMMIYRTGDLKPDDEIRTCLKL